MRSAWAVLAVVLLVGCAGRSAARANEEGLAALSRSDYRTAVSAFGEAVKADPSSTRYRYNLGLALGQAGLYQQSVTELETVLRMDPGDVEARRTLGKVQARLDDSRATDVATAIQH